MLSIDIRTLDSRAIQVAGELPVDDPVWVEGDPLPAQPVAVAGRLSSAGPGRYYFSGRLDGVATGECRRCLNDVRVDVSEEVNLFFMETGVEGAEDDDSETYLIDPRAHAIDLRPAVREHWLLSAPAYALCREDCKGLCPTCGADLNAGPCACARDADSRWDALRKLRSGAEQA
jgi:uncharacterized protein